MDCESNPLNIENSYNAISQPNTEILITRPVKKSNSERCKEYRRKKKLEKQLEDAKKVNKVEKRQPKTSVQRAREYRERKRKLQQLLLQEENNSYFQRTEEKSRAVYHRKYRRKKKLENQLLQLKAVLATNDSNVPHENRKLQMQITNAHIEHPEEVIRNNSFEAPYRHINECAHLNAIYYHDTNIPSDGNCFFFSIKKIMQLSTSPSQIRRQLLASPFVKSCNNPDGVRSILGSETECVEMDCIGIFANVYNQNVCVHNYDMNTSNNREERQFLNFRVNDSPSFLHLHLRNEHFTPLIAVEEMNVNNGKYNQDLDDTSLDIFSDVNFESDNNHKDDTHDVMTDINDIRITIPIYSNYYKHAEGHLQFYNSFKNNTFGHSCAVCDRLWWERDLKNTTKRHDDILGDILPNYTRRTAVKVCPSCIKALNNKKIPLLSTYNGFSFPVIPPDLPKLNLIEQRLISPRIPFTQIRRLRHVNNKCGIYGQIINVPVKVNTMVNQLPRNMEDDYSFYVRLEKKLIHKTSYVHKIINKSHIEKWLTYLVKTPLYVDKKITIDEAALSSYPVVGELEIDEVSERIPMEDDLLTAQQQTLIWNKDKTLHTALGERSILFDDYAEELSFPTIYGGQFRTYRDGCNVTPYMQAISELRRTDRRATDPQHLLYLAAKIMRQRVSRYISVASKHVEDDPKITQNQDDPKITQKEDDPKITKENIQSEDYINDRIESNLAFLRCIPNSAWYWADRKKDLLAMIRQFGAPTVSMTLSANETGWTDLIKLLYKLKNNTENIDDKFISQMSHIKKAQLVNEDAVTCAIYFNKLVNCLLQILQSEKENPFGKYRVKYYYKRIQFQHGSPHAHILLWLDNALEDSLNNCHNFNEMIENLVSVSESKASENIKLQTHKHTFTCYKKMSSNEENDCRYGAPFLPSRNTITLMPMKDTDPEYSVEKITEYKKRYDLLRTNLENCDYDDIDHFYADNGIICDEHYYDIIRAGIDRPKLLYRRTPSEKWHNTFNPFVLHCLQSNMDFQIILDEYDCAAHVSEYVFKHNRGISNLQRMIIQTMEENPDFDIVDITRKIGIDILHGVEMSAQEAAWYLLHEPMSKASVEIVYIPTIHPTERQRIRKILKELNDLHDDFTNMWKKDWFDKYEKRPEALEKVTLAQFVANYNVKKNGEYHQRKTARVIRYHNYDVAKNLDDYRREMVLLHIPFQDEANDVLAEDKFIQIYEDNKDLILERRKEFESSLDIENTLEIYRQLDRDDDEDEQLRNEGNSITAIAKRRENIKDTQQFSQLVRSKNSEQYELPMNNISHLQNQNRQEFQIFFTNPANSGKMFVMKLIMEIYNRFTDNDEYRNSYIACARTREADVAIGDTTIYTALKISISKLLLLSSEISHSYRSLFRHVKVLIIDEISTITAELLAQIDLRLKRITGSYNADFGGIGVILIGDLRQAPPVRATLICKRFKIQMIGPHLWRCLKFHQLSQVMRQVHLIFSSILMKIGNGGVLEQSELEIIESRFFKKGDVRLLSPHGIRLFLTNAAVDSYNNEILQKSPDKVISIATDVIIGSRSAEQEGFFRRQLHKKSLIDTGGLPYQITFVKGKYYFITTNIDVTDSLVNGAVGKLVHLDLNEDNVVCRIWLEFCGPSRVGQKARNKAASLAVDSKFGNLAVPIELRTFNIILTRDKMVTVQRRHFPVIPACAMTIHKSQGGPFDQIVYEYDKKHPQQLVYAALSQVTSVEGLFIVTRDDDETKFRFHHNRVEAGLTESLLQEFDRLASNELQPIAQTIRNFIVNNKGISFLTLDVRNPREHSIGPNDTVERKSRILFLSETLLDDKTEREVPNFNCVCHFKRKSTRVGGVAIHRDKNGAVNVLTSNIELIMNNIEGLNVTSSSVADISVAECVMENGVTFIMAVIYVSPNQKINDIQEFIYKSLILYSKSGSDILGINETKLQELPLVLAGDFNIDFGDKKSEPFVQFLFDEFDLMRNSDSPKCTANYDTTIDAVFSRYSDKIESQSYVSYFRHHKPVDRR